MGTHFSRVRIQYLWSQWINKAATPEETDELFRLLHDPELQDDLWALIPKDTESSLTDELSAQAKEQMLKRILHEGAGGNVPLRKPAMVRHMWWRYAAAAVAIAAFTLILSNFLKTPSSQTPVSAAAPAISDVQPGGQKAVLTLADGSTIVLDGATNGILAKEGRTQIEKTADGHILYRAAGDVKSEQLLNTMSTPRGGLYQLTLSDGTKVWLNAASSITYPTVFAASSRTVSITGEAYFEVAKDPSKPFTVKTRGEAVQVLGTHFNINSYADEPHVKTSLLEGFVAIGNFRLHPGEGYSSGKVYRCDVDMDVAWKNGSFAFNNADLQSVMRQLSRWYDLDIVFEGKIPAGTFSGEIGRSLTLNQLLKGLTTTKIKYRLENEKKMVIISD